MQLKQSIKQKNKLKNQFRRNSHHQKQPFRTNPEIWQKKSGNPESRKENRLKCTQLEPLTHSTQETHTQKPPKKCNQTSNACVLHHCQLNCARTPFCCAHRKNNNHISMFHSSFGDAPAKVAFSECAQHHCKTIRNIKQKLCANIAHVMTHNNSHTAANEYEI